MAAGHNQKASYGCDTAPPVSEGHVLRDSKQRTWTVGKPIGSGAFGAIYSCDPGERKVRKHFNTVRVRFEFPYFPAGCRR